MRPPRIPEKHLRNPEKHLRNTGDLGARDGWSMLKCRKYTPLTLGRCPFNVRKWAYHHIFPALRHISSIPGSPISSSSQIFLRISQIFLRAPQRPPHKVRISWNIKIIMNMVIFQNQQYSPGNIDDSDDPASLKWWNSNKIMEFHQISGWGLWDSL